MEFELHWIRALWLLALPLAALPWLPGKRWDGPWKKVVDPALAPFLLQRSGQGSGSNWRLVCSVLLALCIVALAGPAYRQVPLAPTRGGDALVVVLDVSRSMLAGDLTPSRLDRARLKIREGLRIRTYGETGLVAFSGHAFTVAPLTSDAATLINLLDVLTPDIMPSQGSDTAAAVTRGHRLLRQAGVSAGRVLLLTDAAGGERAVEAARALRADGHMLLVLGTATRDGAPVPDQRGDFLRDDWSDLVVSRADQDALLRLAREGGGAYRRITADNGDLQELLARGRGGRAEVLPAGVSVQRWRDEGPLLLLLMAPLAALAFRRGWLLLLLAAPLGAIAADGWFRTSDQQAIRVFEDGDYRRAADLFEAPAWRAAALYRQNRFLEAARVLDGSLAPRDRYNRATAMAQAEEFENAIRLYEELLVDHPDHADARHNLEVLKQRTGRRAAMAAEAAEAAAERASDPLEQAPGEADGQPVAGDGADPDESLLPDHGQRWLLQVPDDPGGLLRRKFLRQYKAQGVDQDGNSLWPGGEAEPW